MAKGKPDGRKGTIQPKEPTTPLGLGIDRNEIELIENLMRVAQGTALILWGVSSCLHENDRDTLFGGLAAALAAVSAQVDLHYFGDVGIDISQRTVHPEDLACVFEKQAAKLGAKAAARAN
ncbi:MAG: hypothetical protein ACE5H2_08750 [Terriglobia bacterium]